MKMKKIFFIVFIFINTILLPVNAMPMNPHHNQNMPPHHQGNRNIPYIRHPHHNFGIYTRNTHYLNTIYYDDYFMHPYYNRFKDINLILNFKI